MKQEVQEIFDHLCGVIGFSIDKVLEDAAAGKGRAIRLSTMDIEQDLVKANNYLQTDRPWFALHILQYTTKIVVDLIKDKPVEDLIKNIGILTETVEYSKRADELYADWLNTDYDGFIDNFKGKNIFTADELTADTISPDFLIQLDDTVSKGLLKSFKYKDGTDRVNSLFGKPFRLSEQLYITDSIQGFFDYLKRTDHTDDVVYVNFLMKIEPREDMSYFLLTFSYKDHVWLVTDNGFDFKNPYNKATTRNPRRRRENYYENVAFPYGYIDELNEIRRESKQLKRFDDNLTMELYMRPIKDLPVYNKLFLITTIEHFIGTLGEGLQFLGTLHEHVDQKLLTTSEIRPADITGFEDWTTANQEAYQEITDSLNSGTDLIKVSAEVIRSNELYDPNWLGTPEQLDVVAKWSLLNAEAEATKKKLDEKFGAWQSPENRIVRENAEAALNILLNKEGNFERLIPILFSAKDTVYYELKELRPVYDNGKASYKEKLVKHKFKHIHKNQYFIQLRLGFDPFEFKKRCDKWNDFTYRQRVDNNHDDFLFRPKCQCCNKFKVSTQMYIEINHYDQLLFLCNTDKNELPEYLRSYKSTDCTVGYGNSILNNVHPLAMVQHPSTRDYKQGLAIEVMMCGVCARKLYNRHSVAENTILTVDKKIIPETGKIDKLTRVTING